MSTMNTNARNRQSAGQPTGGQFATEARGTDTGVDLAAVSAAHDHPTTPTGMALLRRDADAAARNGDTEVAEHLGHRLAEVDRRVNESTPAGRGFSHRTAMPVGEPWSDDEDDDENRAARLAQEWGVAGVSKVGASTTDDGGWEHTPHKVTLMVDDPDGGEPRSETFDYKMGTAHGDTPPTCATVLNNLALDATSVEDADGDAEEWARNMGVDTDEWYDDPAARDQVERDLRQIERDAERVAALIGTERFEQLKYGSQA